MGTRIEITPGPDDKPGITPKSLAFRTWLSGLFRKLPVVNGRRYTVVGGQIRELGTLQTLTSFHTRNTGGTYGRFSLANPGISSRGELPMFDRERQNGSFWALRRDYSTTSPEESHSISLLKVGSTTFTDLTISQRALFEILEKGDEVVVIVAERSAILLAVKNKTRDVTIGSKESLFGHACFALFMGVLIVFTRSLPWQIIESFLLILTIRSWIAAKASWKSAEHLFGKM